MLTIQNTVILKDCNIDWSDVSNNHGYAIFGYDHFCNRVGNCSSAKLQLWLEIFYHFVYTALKQIYLPPWLQTTNKACVVWSVVSTAAQCLALLPCSSGVLGWNPTKDNICMEFVWVFCGFTGPTLQKHTDWIQIVSPNGDKDQCEFLYYAVEYVSTI